MKKIVCLILPLIMSISIFSGCGNKTDSNKAITNEVEITSKNVTFVDANGKKVTINRYPKKVVCLYNSYLDLWYKCGGQVVGRVNESKEKEVDAAINASSVGSEANPSLKMILSLRPDIVILSTNFKLQMALVEPLENNGIQVIVCNSELKDDYFNLVRIFTALTGREDLYKKNGCEVKKKIDDIIAKVPKGKKPKVMLIIAAAKGLTAKNSRTTVGEMLKDLGTVNIADNLNSGNSNTFSMEMVLKEDPDFIFVQTMGSNMDNIKERLKKDAESNPAWSSLKAVKNGKYIILPKDLYLYKPNDRYAEAYEGLARYLYPEIFK